MKKDEKWPQEEKCLKMAKKWPKNHSDQLSGACSNQKLVKIHNSHIFTSLCLYLAKCIQIRVPYLTWLFKHLQNFWLLNLDWEMLWLWLEVDLSGWKCAVIETGLHLIQTRSEQPNQIIKCPQYTYCLTCLLSWN